MAPPKPRAPQIVRPRHEPPTLREALEVAADLADSAADRIAIAAGLLGCSEDEVKQRAGADIMAPRQPQPPMPPMRTLGLPQGHQPRAVMTPRKREFVVERVRSRAVAR